MKKVVIGIPTYNEAENIGHVVKQVDSGLKKLYEPKQCLIVNLDSDSEDETRQVFLQTSTFCPKEYLNTGRRPRGKGKNLLRLFEFCMDLKADFVATIDGDVQTVKTSWPSLLLKPIISKKYDYTVPVYTRKYFDGNVTNHFAYPLIYAVFGFDLRQPIGGEFGLSKPLYSYLLKQSINDAVLKYGIDIFMTCHAIGGCFKIAEVYLGKKLHKPGFSGLMYKFLQIARVAIETSKLYKSKPLKTPLFRKHKIAVGIEKVGTPPNKEKVLLQLKESTVNFQKNKIDYYKYLGKLADKVNQIVESGKPELSADLWTSILARFLNICYKKTLNERLISKITNLIAPIFFWRSISFWEEIKGLSQLGIERKIKNQANLLKNKLS